MTSDYNKVRSISDEEVKAANEMIERARTDPRYSKVSVEVLEKVERFLDAKPGILQDIEGYTMKQDCGACGKELTLLDKVVTGLVDTDHTKSFMLHTMIGSKKTKSRLPFVRCTNCGHISPSESEWHFWVFLYCDF